MRRYRLIQIKDYPRQPERETLDYFTSLKKAMVEKERLERSTWQTWIRYVIEKD